MKNYLLRGMICFLLLTVLASCLFHTRGFMNYQKDLLDIAERDYSSYQNISFDALKKSGDIGEPEKIAQQVIQNSFQLKNCTILSHRSNSNRQIDVFTLGSFPKFDYFMNYRRMVGGTYSVVISRENRLVYFQGDK